MTHFRVMVVVDKGDNVESIMAPYQKNNMGDCPKEYLEFVDETDELIKNYNQGRKLWFDKNGNMYKSQVWSKEGIKFLYKVRMIVNDFDYSEYYYLNENENNEWNIPHGFYEGIVPWKYFTTLHDYLSDGQLEVNGRYGYMYNPNSKWDYYSILDTDFRSAVNDVNNSEKLKNDAIRNYKIWEKEKDKWNEFQESKDTARREEILDNLDTDDWLFLGSLEERHLENLNKSLKEYIEWYSRPVAYTHAIVDKNGWIEEGEVGWFGSIKKEINDWDTMWNEYFNSISKESNVVLVDCHV